MKVSMKTMTVRLLLLGSSVAALALAGGASKLLR